VSSEKKPFENRRLFLIESGVKSSCVSLLVDEIPHERNCNSPSECRRCAASVASRVKVRRSIASTSCGRRVSRGGAVQLEEGAFVYHFQFFVIVYGRGEAPLFAIIFACGLRELYSFGTKSSDPFRGNRCTLLLFCQGKGTE